MLFLLTYPGFTLSIFNPLRRQCHLYIICYPAWVSRKSNITPATLEQESLVHTTTICFRRTVPGFQPPDNPADAGSGVQPYPHLELEVFFGLYPLQLEQHPKSVLHHCHGVVLFMSFVERFITLKVNVVAKYTRRTFRGTSILKYGNVHLTRSNAARDTM